MKNKNTHSAIEGANEVKQPKRYSKKMIGLIAAASSITGAGAMGVGMSVKYADRDARAQKTAQEAVDKADMLNETFIAVDSMRSRELSDALEQIDVLASIADVPAGQLEARQSYKKFEAVRRNTISQEVINKQDAATLFLYKRDPSDASGNVMYGCTVVKTGMNTLSSAAHCFPEAQEIYSGDPTINQRGAAGTLTGFSTPYEYYVSKDPALTLDNLDTNAIQITSLSKDYNGTDYAVLSLPEESAHNSEWFSKIEPLEMRYDAPQAGTIARVSGYPQGSDGKIFTSPVTAEGVVLGQMPASLVGFNYLSDLTIVGVDPEYYSSFTCSFSGSGETMADETGNAYGALAYVGRSYNPENSPVVTPNGKQLLEMEEKFKTQLLGEDYILCGFATPERLEPLPLQITPLSPDSGGA